MSGRIKIHLKMSLSLRLSLDGMRLDPREVDSSRRPCATFGSAAFFSRMIMTMHKYEVTERLLAFP